MSQEELMNAIAEIEREIAILPEGSITKKKIRDKEYYYHRITRNGKRVEKYIDFKDVAELNDRIDLRKKLEKDLKELKKQIIPEKATTNTKEEHLEFKTTVRTGSRLRAQIAVTKKYKKRECIRELRDYVFGSQTDKVFVIYGLRRTGKTTMIRQILTELPETEFRKAAFIQVRSRDTLEDIDRAERQGCLEFTDGKMKVFVDEH